MVVCACFGCVLGGVNLGFEVLCVWSFETLLGVGVWGVVSVFVLMV